MESLDGIVTMPLATRYRRLSFLNWHEHTEYGVRSKERRFFEKKNAPLLISRGLRAANEETKSIPARNSPSKGQVLWQPNDKV